LDRNSPSYLIEEGTLLCFLLLKEMTNLQLMLLAKPGNGCTKSKIIYLKKKPFGTHIINKFLIATKKSLGPENISHASIQNVFTFAYKQF